LLPGLLCLVFEKEEKAMSASDFIQASVAIIACIDNVLDGVLSEL